MCVYVLCVCVRARTRAHAFVTTCQCFRDVDQGAHDTGMIQTSVADAVGPVRYGIAHASNSCIVRAVVDARLCKVLVVGLGLHFAHDSLGVGKKR